MSDQNRYRYIGLWWLIGISMISLVIYLSLTSKPLMVTDLKYIDKLEHMLAYAALMGWFSQIFLSINSRIILAILFCLLGISLEILQGWNGYRFFEYGDMVANTVGVLLGTWISGRFCDGWLARLDRALSP